MFKVTTIGKLRVNDTARLQINGVTYTGLIHAHAVYGMQVELEFFAAGDGNWCLSRDYDEPCERLVKAPSTGG